MDILYGDIAYVIWNFVSRPRTIVSNSSYQQLFCPGDAAGRRRVDRKRHSQHEEIITRVTFTSRHPAEDLSNQVLRSGEIQTAWIEIFVVSAGELHTLVSLVFHFDLLEDFDEQLESHLLDDAHKKLVQSVVEHRRDFDVLAAETHRGRFALCNQCTSK